MNIHVNSQERTVPDGATVSALLELLDFTGKRVAVEVNTELVTRQEWAQHRLHEGDRVEIVTFVGGG